MIYQVSIDFLCLYLFERALTVWERRQIARSRDKAKIQPPVRVESDLTL